MKIISVIPLKKGVPKGDLTYFSSLNISAGNVVSVPIRNKKILALVISAEELKEEKSNIKKMNFNLRKVIDNKGNSIFPKEFIDAVFDTSNYFAQKKSSILASLIPNIFIEEYDKLAKISAISAKSKSASEKKKHPAENTATPKPEKLLFQYRLEDRISIYKTMIRESFARNKSIFMVLPTEIDIDKFAEKLQRGIEQFTFSFHSGISDKKNITSYEKAVSSIHPVLIIGTPSFLSIPRKDIGTIILEHENSNAYKSITKPHFDLRIFTEIYAAKIGAKFILADEVLRYETLGRKDIDNLNSLHPLSFRIDFPGEIDILGPTRTDGVSVYSRNIPQKKEKFQIFKDGSIEEIKKAVAEKKKIFIFSLRKGLATMTVCKDCKETVSCKDCGSPLVLYLSHQGNKRMFVCNRCEKEASGDTACANCRSWDLVPIGIGTDTVHEELKRLFPKEKILKLDKESAVSAAGAKKIIKEFEASPGGILIGTEMAFFYLNENTAKKISLSVIVSFDSLWSIPNFKMGEKIIQIVLSTVKNTSHQIIIQTKNETDSAILAIKSRNLLPFIREELEDRRELNYPPFKRFIKITHMGDKEQTLKAKNQLAEIFEDYSPVIFSGFVARLKGKYVTNALIKINPKKWSLPEISPSSEIDKVLLTKLLALPYIFQIIVDPEDLL